MTSRRRNSNLGPWGAARSEGPGPQPQKGPARDAPSGPGEQASGGVSAVPRSARADLCRVKGGHVREGAARAVVGDGPPTEPRCAASRRLAASGAECCPTAQRSCRRAAGISSTF